jgi:arsenate reductase (glutaredoxin)
MDRTTVWHNPRCSKSRGALTLLRERDVDVDERRYLDHPPTATELEELLEQLGVEDPRLIMRTREPAYRELGLGDADRDTLLAAIVDHPILLERPIVVRAGRAVVGRPPERVLELLDP